MPVTCRLLALVVLLLWGYMLATSSPDAPLWNPADAADWLAVVSFGGIGPMMLIVALLPSPKED